MVFKNLSLVAGGNSNWKAEGTAIGYIEITCWNDKSWGTLWFYCGTWCEGIGGTHVSWTRLLVMLTQFLLLMLSFPVIFRLVCSALYNDGDADRKYLPQFFKFIVANPLSVRTKVSSFHLPLNTRNFFRALNFTQTLLLLFMKKYNFIYILLTLLFMLFSSAGSSCQGR